LTECPRTRTGAEQPLPSLPVGSNSHDATLRPFHGKAGGANRLPEQLIGHDLEELAARAAYVPLDDDQRAALAEGRFFIEWIGRYPTMTAAENNPAGFQFHPSSLHAAYLAIFMSCADQVARLTWAPEYGHANADESAVAQRAALEVLLGGVPGP
jgi:hypothetical protein